MTGIDPQSEKCSIGARIGNSNGPVLRGASGTWGSGCCDHRGYARVRPSACRRSSCRIEPREPRGWGGTAAVRRVREVRRERLPVRSGLRAGGRDRGCGPGTSSPPLREVSLRDTGWRGSCWPSAKILWARCLGFQAPCLHGSVRVHAGWSAQSRHPLRPASISSDQPAMGSSRRTRIRHVKPRARKVSFSVRLPRQATLLGFSLAIDSQRATSLIAIEYPAGSIGEPRSLKRHLDGPCAATVGERTAVVRPRKE
jgi:hypothetical protein